MQSSLKYETLGMCSINALYADPAQKYIKSPSLYFVNTSMYMSEQIA